MTAIYINSKYPKNLGYFFYAYKRFKGDLRAFNIATIVIIYRTNKKPLQGKYTRQIALNLRVTEDLRKGKT